mmetsp:Transcript_26579/g.62995  ORF Transcript_26579/g.62995 Transcript_26579/m.62995 type:complete len:254 (-) Transcript_26579:44-805(-)
MVRPAHGRRLCGRQAMEQPPEPGRARLPPALGQDPRAPRSVHGPADAPLGRLRRDHGRRAAPPVLLPEPHVARPLVVPPDQRLGPAVPQPAPPPQDTQALLLLAHHGRGHRRAALLLKAEGRGLRRHLDVRGRPPETRLERHPRGEAAFPAGGLVTCGPTNPPCEQPEAGHRRRYSYNPYSMPMYLKRDADWCPLNGPSQLDPSNCTHIYYFGMLLIWYVNAPCCRCDVVDAKQPHREHSYARKSITASLQQL